MSLTRLKCWVSVALVWGGLFACTPERSEKGAASEPVVLASTRSAQVDPCVLLDNPSTRQRMSGSFESFLLRRCGRVSAATSASGLAAGSAPGVGGSGKLSAAPGSGPDAGAPGGGGENGGIDILVNDPSLDTGGTTQSETSVVAHGNVVCVAWNDAGEGFGLHGFSGFGYSHDGGRTFTDGGPFPDGPGDSNGGDPSLAYSERDGRFYYAALSNVGLSLWQSSDDCQTFSYVGPIHNGFGDDKELIAVDNAPTSPFFGRIYVGWTDFALGGDANVVNYSDDGGASWTAPVSLPGTGGAGQGMWPAIAENGDAYFALVNRSFQIGGLQDQWIYKAVDLGGVLGWQKQTDIATQHLIPENQNASQNCGRQALRGDIRNLSSPQIAISSDPFAPAGYIIHATYPYDSDGPGPDESNVFYRRSVDGAVTWSDELKLNDDETSADQWFPSLGVDIDGTVVVSWYDRRLDQDANLNFDRFVSYSVDAGFTWTPNERISDVTSPVAQTNPNFDSLATCYHGDYDQLSVADGVAHIIWSDDRRITESGPNPDVYYDQVALNPSLGRLNARPNPVSCNGTLEVRLTDADLAGNGAQPVTLLASSGDLEALALIEQDSRPGSFAASIATSPDPFVQNDGTLQITADDSITIEYLDEDTGEGESSVITFVVLADCTPPVINSVGTTLLGGTVARIDVATTEPSELRVDYGFSCGDRPLSATGKGGSVTLTSLLLNTTYFLSVTATDRSGNATTDDNGGACYSFTTPSQIFFEDFEQGLGDFSIDNSAGNGNGLWHLSEGTCASRAKGHTRPNTLYYGRDDTCTFENGFTNEGVAFSPIISLQSTAGAAVEFNYYLGTEGGGFFDQASLAVSVNGGPFQVVESNFNALFVPVELRGMRIRDDAASSGGAALIENSSAWNQSSVSLAGLLEGLDTADIQLEFRFNTIDGAVNQFAGFYVDDVRVVGSVPPQPCSSDADCDDGLFCTGAESCVSGFCQTGIPVACADDGDGIACTVSRCDETAQGCVVSADNDVCDDGALCNGDEICDPLSGCQPGPALECDDGILCTLDQCREDTKSCGGFPQDDLCQDGVFCNGFETCDLGQGCVPGVFPCNDGVNCTNDICNEDFDFCEAQPSDAECNDGLFCNGEEFCDAFAGCRAGFPPCSGDEACDEAQNLCEVTCVTATNGEHVAAGRARVVFDTVHLALGSDDFLGVSPDDVTSLTGGGAFWERTSSCSAVPIVESLQVQVVGDTAIITGTASDANGDLESVMVTVFDPFGIPFEVPAQGTTEFTAVVSGLQPNFYFVFAQGFDRAGNAGVPGGFINFFVDNPQPPVIDSIEAISSAGSTEIRGFASDPNDDIQRVVVTVRQNGQVVASGESPTAAPYSVVFDELPPGNYTARAQAFDTAGFASALSSEVSFTVGAGGGLACITATNTEHQAAGRARALFGNTFFFAEGSFDFLGISGGIVTSLTGSGGFWDRVDSCGGGTVVAAAVP